MLLDFKGNNHIELNNIEINLYKNYFIETIQDASSFQDSVETKEEIVEEDLKKDAK